MSAKCNLPVRLIQHKRRITAAKELRRMHDGQSQNLLASARTLVDVEPFYLGRHPSAAQSERLRGVFRERTRAASQCGDLDLDPYPSSRGHRCASGFQDSVGSCSTRPIM